MTIEEYEKRKQQQEIIERFKKTAGGRQKLTAEVLKHLGEPVPKAQVPPWRSKK